MGGRFRGIMAYKCTNAFFFGFSSTLSSELLLFCTKSWYWYPLKTEKRRNPRSYLGIGLMISAQQSLFIWSIADDSRRRLFVSFPSQKGENHSCWRFVLLSQCEVHLEPALKMDTLKEFFESSTIHGVRYISSAKVSKYPLPNMFFV